MLSPVSALFAKSVLIGSVPPNTDRFPRQYIEQSFEGVITKDGSPFRFTIAVIGMNNARQQPHRKERNRRPHRVTRFGDETTASRLQDTKHFINRPLLFGKNRKHP